MSNDEAEVTLVKSMLLPDKCNQLSAVLYLVP